MAESVASDAATQQRPIRPGLFVEAGETRARPRLLGSRCRKTGQLFWPAERMNPVTHESGTMEPAEIEGGGHIVSYTVVQRGLPGYPSPYAIAAIQLDAGPSLIAQLEDWQGAALRTGMAVRLVIGTIRTERDGTRVTGPKFQPVVDT
ncbi:MAG: OB-fold domain-containing protein [Alphaproteobacteria bacterium]|nr:OB-fold domain-containing protein [Alphaproteobacteria bacterium]